MRVQGFFLKKAICFIFVLLFVFNPYTIIGPLAFFLIPLVLASFVSRFKGLDLELIIIPFFLILISMIGVLSSFFHDIGQFVHLKVSVSVFVYILLAHSAYVLFFKGGFKFNDFLHCVLLASSFNSLLIIFEVYFPSLRQFIESFLVLSGNIVWTEGFRYRGIASGGGAALSVLIPVSVVLALHLYSEKYFNLVSSCVHISILIFSVFFIGRTGLILLPVVALAFLFFNARLYLLRTLISSLLLAVLLFLFSDYIKQSLIDQYGVGFYNYSVGFLFSGVSGVQDEGTVGTIIGFLKVMPTTFPEVIVGHGFYGGSDFQPWTDSGYSRMFLSVGYIAGFLYYLSLFVMFRNAFSYKPFLFFSIGCVLLIAEAKEPLLFSGYSARLYILILVVGLLSKKGMYQVRSRNKQSSIEAPPTLGSR